MKDQLIRYARAGYAGLFLCTPEEARAEAVIKAAADELDRPLHAWSLTTGFVDTASGSVRDCPDPVQALEQICRDIADNETGTRINIVHRLGDVPLGEPSVAIVAASPHRAAAYEASRVALERLKKEVPTWKREHFADGSAAWREEERLAANSGDNVGSA